MTDSKGHGLSGACIGKRGTLKKEKRQQAPALQMELSTESIIPEDREKSRKTLQSKQPDTGKPVKEH